MKTAWVSLLTVHPRDKGRRNIRSRDVRERISTADARIQINDAESLVAQKKIAIQNSDVAQVLADGLAKLFKSLILYRQGAVGR